MFFFINNFLNVYDNIVNTYINLILFNFNIIEQQNNIFVLSVLCDGWTCHSMTGMTGTNNSHDIVISWGWGSLFNHP